MENILNTLNNEQLLAVKSIEGPILVLAGAGSGKTKVVTTKIAYLIKDLQVHPQEILAFTFTNKAANEMKARVSLILDTNVNSLWIGTFHSICVRILRRDLNFSNYNKNFSIYDTTDQKSLIKECLKEINLDEKIFTPKFVQSKISSLKNESITVDIFERDAYNPIDKGIYEIYKLYEKKKVQNNAFDFDDLILKTIELLKKDDMVRRYYQERFRFVFVDEYQDTNNPQYELIKLLTGIHNNICAVGDADQSIYKWRGANINNILNFEKDFKNSKRIILSQNYRSTKNILNTANNAISKNSKRIKKDLWTANVDGNKPSLFIADNDMEEASYVSNEIEKLLSDGANPDEIAILYRSNSLSRIFEEALMKRSIKYKVIGGIKFYDRAEIKDILAYLRLIVNKDDDISFKRIINEPKRGIGDVTIDKLATIANEKNISLFAAISFIDEYDKLFNINTSKKLNDFKNLIDNLILKSSHMSILELLDFLLDRIEYIEILKRQGNIEANSKIDNIEEFKSSISIFEEQDGGNLHEFLTGVSLLSDIDKTEEKNDAVSLITVHSAKGLEFENVFLVAMEEGIFPSAFSIEDDDLEEERRLMYVAITRAKKKLVISLSKIRTRFGKSNYQMKSTFVDEVEDTLDLANKNVKKFVPRENYKNYNNVFSYKKDINITKKYEKDKININSSKNYAVGQKVNHKKWGLGEILKIDMSSGDILITVAFENGKTKTLIGDLAPMEVVND